VTLERDNITDEKQDYVLAMDKNWVTTDVSEGLLYIHGIDHSLDDAIKRYVLHSRTHVSCSKFGTLGLVSSWLWEVSQRISSHFCSTGQARVILYSTGLHNARRMIRRHTKTCARSFNRCTMRASERCTWCATAWARDSFWRDLRAWKICSRLTAPRISLPATAS